MFRWGGRINEVSDGSLQFVGVPNPMPKLNACVTTWSARSATETGWFTDVVKAAFFSATEIPDEPNGTLSLLVRASGIGDDTRAWANDQPFVGRVRRYATGARYESTPLTGTISKTNGLTLNVALIPEA